MWTVIVDFIGFASSVAGLVSAGYGLYRFLRQNQTDPVNRLVLPDMDPRQAARAAARAAARRKVEAPGMALVVVGVLNCFLGGIIGAAGALGVGPSSTTGSQTKEQRPQTAEEARKDQVMGVLVGACMVLCGIGSMFGGLAMRSLRVYPVAMIGSILATCNFMCFCVAPPIGIWSLLVLHAEDVRSTFD